MRMYLWTGLALLALCLMVPGAVSAQDRPDIPDVPASLTPPAYATTTLSPLNVVGGTVVISGSNGGASNYASHSRIAVVGSNVAGVGAVVYEPDQVEREFNRQKVVQRDFAGMQLIAGQFVGGAIVTTTSGSASQASGCKANGKVRDFDAPNQTYNSAVFVGTCSDAGLNSLIANPAGRARIKSVFGTKPNGTGFKSKTVAQQTGP